MTGLAVEKILFVFGSRSHDHQSAASAQTMASSIVACMTLCFLANNRHHNLQNNLLLHIQIIHAADW